MASRADQRVPDEEKTTEGSSSIVYPHNENTLQWAIGSLQRLIS
jgi:hypothetical protein